MRRPRPLVLLLALALPLTAQGPVEVARERSEFRAWLASDPLSPYAALGLAPVGPGLSIGAEPADLPLAGVPRGIITEDGPLVILTTGGARRVLPRLRPIPLGPGSHLVVSGVPGRAVVASFGAVRRAKAPHYYDYDPAARLESRLEPPERRGRFRVLGLDGAETEASEVGFVTVRFGGSSTRLRVYRLGGADEEEAPLFVFFRDATNDHGTYPAGRFLELTPTPSGAFEVDFNRARNPFCAYSSIFPCPAPWPGNRIAAAVRAGERYPAVAATP